MKLTDKEISLVVKELKPLDGTDFDKYIDGLGICEIKDICRLRPSEVLKHMSPRDYEIEQEIYFTKNKGVKVGLSFYNKQEVENLLENFGGFMDKLSWEGLYLFYTEFADTPPKKYHIKHLISCDSSQINYLFEYITTNIYSRKIEVLGSRIDNNAIKFIRGKKNIVFGYDYYENNYWIGDFQKWEEIRNKRNNTLADEFFPYEDEDEYEYV